MMTLIEFNGLVVYIITKDVRDPLRFETMGNVGRADEAVEGVSVKRSHRAAVRIRCDT